MIDDPRDFEDSALTRADASTPGPDRAIGAYRLLQRIGEGGMGEVWLADQTHPIRRRVALKVIKPGMDSKQVIARFEAERQALAVMDHPAVATVFDGGTTPDGRPYFVMEYVKGDPITSYADGHRLAIVDRIALFIQVCEGVQHAHQKGIIHRDLKPSNILVAEDGERHLPKIIDFGVAKATTTSLTDRTLYTELGSMIGTLEYMSPEQAQLTATDIDTRSDVYSLGVILYELLTGRLPFDSQMLRAQGLDHAQRTIREVNPGHPSTRVTADAADAATAAERRRSEPARLASQLRGDLDWVVLKALEKDRNRRYVSAADLAADLRRHLQSEPVLASPPSTTYRLRKFARRHRRGVIGAGGFAVLLVAFLSAMLLQAARIARERDRANREADAATKVSEFLVGLFQVSDPSEARGNTLTAREILDKGARDIDGNLQSQPEIQARLQTTIGAVYTNLGAYVAAEESLKKAVETFRRTMGEEAPQTLAATNQLAALFWYKAQYANAEALYARIVEVRTRTLGAEHRDTLKSKFDLASVYLQQKRWDDMERLARPTLEAQRRVFGEADPDTLSSMHNLAGMYYAQGRYGDALPIAVRVMDVRTRVLGALHPLTLRAVHNAATNYDRLNRFGEAEPLYRKALADERRVLGNTHPETINTAAWLSEMYVRQGRYADAEPLLLAAAQSFEQLQTEPEERIVRDFVELYEKTGQLSKAAEWRAKQAPGQPASR